MYRDLQEIYWWGSLKKDRVNFMVRCPNFQQVKAEHQNPEGLTQILDVPTWKWEYINMDFVVGLPRTRSQNDSIWVIVDRLTKSSHFIPVKPMYSTEEYARLYINKIVSIHGIHVFIILDKGA